MVAVFIVRPSLRLPLALLSAALPVVVVAGGVWHISGPCSTVLEEPNCIVSPGFPSQYGHDETCKMRWYAIGDWFLQVESFETESCCDLLVVNGYDYSGAGGSDLAADRHTLSGDVTWESDSSINGRGWKLCARPLGDAETDGSEVVANSTTMSTTFPRMLGEWDDSDDDVNSTAMTTTFSTTFTETMLV